MVCPVTAWAYEYMGCYERYRCSGRMPEPRRGGRGVSGGIGGWRRVGGRCLRGGRFDIRLEFRLGGRFDGSLGSSVGGRGNMRVVRSLLLLWGGPLVRRVDHRVLV